MSRMSEPTRRQFITTTTAALAGAALITGTQNACAVERPHIVKSLKFGMVAREDASGKKLSIAERMQVAADAGFRAVEPDTIFDERQLDETGEGAEKAGLKVDGIICSTHWGSPLSDPDPAVYEKTIEGMRQSIRNAKALGGDMVLLVPAVVNPKVRYREAWVRSVERIKPLADYAGEHGITIGIENVWNKFLLSPVEAKAYIEEIDHPRVRFWVDVGNMVLFGYPQDWVRTLGPLIARVDIKDFQSDNKSFVPLLEGSVDWPEVMRAFDEIGYRGVFAAEVKGGDLRYLSDVVSKPMDKIISS